MNGTFDALLLEQDGEQVRCSLRTLPLSALPDGEVQIAVEYSSLNYKDALILSGRGYAPKTLPLVPGIDLAGVVTASKAPDFKPGDRVVLNGAGAGESTWGGYAQRASVSSSALVHLPDTLSTWQAMAYGTAGLAAALSVLAIENHAIHPDSGPVLVTGAGGGVGSLAVLLLRARGFEVVASAGSAKHDFLKKLGASDVTGRIEAGGQPPGPLGPETFSAAVDTVGGATLAAALARIKYGGLIAVTGFAGGMNLESSLAPLLLRAISLQGVNTSACPRPRRRAAWRLMAETLNPKKLESIAEEIDLIDVPDVSLRLLDGEIRGRIVVNTAGGPKMAA